jgi:hypothetical protein
MLEVMPKWSELADADRAQVVAFLRTAEDEGTSYAWENYPPKFPEGSALRSLGSGQQMRALYGSDYAALGYGVEFWRLYEMGT